MPTYNSFREFYPFYLSQHLNPVCRRLHVVGSLGVLALPVLGYGFAWVGHFFFEHNRPATFTYPLYSLMGDWVMLWDVLRGKLR